MALHPSADRDHAEREQKRYMNLKNNYFTEREILLILGERKDRNTMFHHVIYSYLLYCPYLSYDTDLI